MDSKQTGISMLMVSAFAGVVGFIAFVALMVVGEWAFSPAAFVAILVAAVAYVVLLLGFFKGPPQPERELPEIGSHTADASVGRSEPPSQPMPSAPEPSQSAPEIEPTAVQASKALPGQDDLSSRKGEWSYNGAKEDDAGKADDAAENPGTKPETLSSPRDGGADNLKEIKGVGPKLEELLNSMGFYHFDQIANWTDDEVAWVDDNLEGFKGRVSRDDWVAQAKTLAAGGDTEFSKRVDKGEVY